MAGAAPSPMLQAALWYADVGYPVFPCAPGQKTPLTEHGLLDATTDPEQIERWWTKHADANVAIRTDGLVAIDIDGADNPWLIDEPDKLAELARAPTSLTPRGGRQHLFRQPEGRAWRNTAGQIAPHVDTRADGGYICVTPSVVNGKPYRWADGPSLHIPPEQLPKPPAWLTALLDAASASGGTPASPCDAHGNAIPQGQRNATLARLAGAMRRVGMSRTEILAALLRVNIERCHPPLDQREVERVAASIARYAPDAVSVALVENHFAQDSASAPEARPLTVGELLRQCPMLRPPVIMGLLRQGETMNLIAPPKTGKSWLVLALAMAVASGRLWLDTFETVTGRVLILDNELHRETIAHRVPQVAAALGVGMDEIRERIEVHSQRGRLRDILSMAAYFDALEPGRYALVILDAMYRFMPVGTDENDNGTMASIYNRIDAFADRLGCCFVVVHHTTKGNQSAKSVTDVGAGAGSQSRATDTHVVMRPHQEPGAVVLEAAVRSWPPVEPMALRWLFPLWKPAPDLDPTELRGEKRKAKGNAQAEWSVDAFVQAFVTPEVRPRDVVLGNARTAGLSAWRATCLLREAEARGLIHRHARGRNRPSGYSTRPPAEEGSEA